MHVTRLRARLGCALASTVVVASLLAAAGCTSLPSVELGGCGDGIVEPERGEDCDRGGDCGAPGTAQACRLTCTVTTDCPAGAVCGATGVCSVPAARFERADGDELPFTSRFLIASDVDDDGDADLIGVDDVAVAVRAGAAGATFAPPVMLPGVPVQGLPVAADFTGDGADDVVFSAGIGTEVLTAANAGSFEPTFQPTFNLGGTGGFVANTIVYAQPAPDDGRDAAVGSLVVAVDLAPGAACPNGCSVLSIDDEAVLMPGHADALLVPRLPIAQVRTPANPAREEFVVALPFADSNPNLPGDQDGLFLARAQTGLNPGDAATLSPPAPVTLPTGAKLVGATFADLDGLAGRELVVSYTVAQVARLAIAVGRADGTFGALTPVSFAGGVVAPTPLAFVDVTPGYYDELLAADGVSLISCDLIAASCERTSVSAASVPWQDVAVGDLDGDGFTDVVAARKSTSTIDVRLGTGLPFFWNPASMSAPGEVKAIRVGDFDGNDVADVAVAFSTDGTGSAVDLAMAFGAYLAPPTAPVRIARIGKLLALEPSQQVALGLDLVEDLLMVFERGGTRSGSVLLGSATRNLIAPQLPTGEGQPVGVESLTVEAVVATPFADQPTPSLISLVVGRGLFETRPRSVGLWRLVADGNGDLTATAIVAAATPAVLVSAFEFADALWTAIVGADGVTRIYGGDRRGTIALVPLSGCPAACALQQPEALVPADAGDAMQIAQLTSLDLDGRDARELVAIRSPRGDVARASEVLIWRGGVGAAETVTVPDGRRAYAAAALRTAAAGPASLVVATDGGLLVAAPDAGGRYGALAPVELAVRDAAGEPTAAVEPHAVGITVADLDRDGLDDLIVSRGGDPRTPSALAIYTQAHVPGGAGLAAEEGQ